jgi:hypothetical protein
MLLLSQFTTGTLATVTGTSIGSSVNAIFEGLVNIGAGKSLFGIGASASTGEFNEVAMKTCAAFVSKGTDSLVGCPLLTGNAKRP